MTNFLPSRSFESFKVTVEPSSSMRASFSCIGEISGNGRRFVEDFSSRDLDVVLRVSLLRFERCVELLCLSLCSSSSSTLSADRPSRVRLAFVEVAVVEPVAGAISSSSASWPSKDHWRNHEIIFSTIWKYYQVVMQVVLQN